MVLNIIDEEAWQYILQFIWFQNPLTIIKPASDQIMAWHRTGDKSSSEQMVAELNDA